MQVLLLQLLLGAAGDGAGAARVLGQHLELAGAECCGGRELGPLLRDLADDVKAKGVDQAAQLGKRSPQVLGGDALQLYADEDGAGSAAELDEAIDGALCHRCRIAVAAPLARGLRANAGA